MFLFGTEIDYESGLLESGFKFINPNVSLGDDIEKFANKLFHHYEYDDKINKYLKSFFSFGSSNTIKALKVNKSFQNIFFLNC